MLLDLDVFRCWRAWSLWFFDVAWDVTWVIIDRRLQRASLLFTTDTDRCEADDLVRSAYDVGHRRVVVGA